MLTTSSPVHGYAHAFPSPSACNAGERNLFRNPNNECRIYSVLLKQTSPQNVVTVWLTPAVIPYTRNNNRVFYLYK